MKKPARTMRDLKGVKIPEVPNYLIIEGGLGAPTPIHMFTEAALREIGRRWTAELIKKGRERRAAERKGLN